MQVEKRDTPGRAAAPLRLQYDPALPITAHHDEILAALARHPVLIVCGATGSGKTTQLPKLCLEAGRATAGIIGHTQPRRIAARALADRLAEELGTSVGGAVGWQVRFTDHTGPDTRVKLMTDGILLKELESDRMLRRYDTLIIDEAHERTLNIDLLLGALRQVLPRRPELKVIVTSATIDPQKLSGFFDGAPVIEVSGRSYPVEVRYRPLDAEDEDSADLSLPEGVLAAVKELDAPGGVRGDTLVFLPGEQQIREVAEHLNKAKLTQTEVLPLFARLSAAEQARIFQRHAGRRIVLSTNVAETSLTVPGIRSVIDAGLARISRYSVRGKVQRLPIEPVSKASAEQRKGRCGREAPGICIRLYSEGDFEQREDFTPPEVLRTNLAQVLLRMAAANLGDPETFPFLDPPDSRLVNDGVRLLQELKAMDEERRITSLGRRIAVLPVDPRLGAMLLAAERHRCLAEMLIVASFLEVQDPRERPQDAREDAQEKHALFADRRSDFIAVLNLWRAFTLQAEQLSGSALRRWCREHFLSFVRLREWQDLHSQLSRSVAELKLRRNNEAASYADLHQAILTGFLGSIGNLEERRDYAGPRGIRFVIAPGTPLAAHPPKWVVAGSLVETSRVFARMVAAVDPGWIEAAGAHLVRRSHSEPHWVPARGFVAAFEAVSLYGLTLASRRRINYGTVEPAEAHRMFIREALLTEPAEQGAPRREPDERHPRGHHSRAGRRGEPPGAHVEGAFLVANRRLRGEIESLEVRIRRRDILVDEERQLALYAARIPQRINSVAAFNHWRIEAERREPALLLLRREELMERAAPEAGREHFPDTLQVGANQLPLSYRFEPAESDDGITLTVPEALLDALDGEQLAWLVPGLRLEKITALFRELPKTQRKQLVPVPEHARRALEDLAADTGPDGRLPGFYEWLARWISQRVGEVVDRQQLADAALPAHLRLNLRVVDADDRVLAEGRELVAIRRRLHGPIATQAPPSGHAPEGLAVYRRWDFGELPAFREVERNRLRLTVYPALKDVGTGVTLIEARNAAAAEAVSRAAVVRLAILALPQQAKLIAKRMADEREIVLLSRGLSPAQPLADALTQRTFRECFLPEGSVLPRTAQAFEEMLDAGRARLVPTGDELATIIVATLREWRAARARLDSLHGDYAGVATEVGAQLGALLPSDFIESTPRPWLDHLPRYLKAVVRRLERLPGNARRDAELEGQVKPFDTAVRQLSAQPTATPLRPELSLLRWMTEELRVSLHAQDLKTAVRVSGRRLTEQLEKARIEARG
jgi:ATP-dependent helicase HrpA